jgi:hypothetical protein
MWSRVGQGVAADASESGADSIGREVPGDLRPAERIASRRQRRGPISSGLTGQSGVPRAEVMGIIMAEAAPSSPSTAAPDR